MTNYNSIFKLFYAQRFLVMNNLGKFRYFSKFSIKNCILETPLLKNQQKQIIFSIRQIHTSYKRLDIKTPEKSVLVYEAPLKTRVKVVKLLSLASSMVGFAVFPRAIYDIIQVNVFMGAAVGVVSAFFLSTPFMLNWITKRYVLELHFDNETKTFTAKTYNIISQITEFQFKAEDVIVPELPGMLSSFLVNGKPLFVDANMILDPDAYSHMMGYDKPFDITLKMDEHEKDAKKS